MSHKRPRISKRSNWMAMPIDNISPNDKKKINLTLHSSPTRYKKTRSNPISEKIINDLTSKNFLPESMSIKTPERKRKLLKVEDMDIGGRINNNSHTRNENNEIDDDQFERISNSSPLRKLNNFKNRNLGLLESSSSPIPNEKIRINNTSMKYNIPGIFTVIDRYNKKILKEPVIMTFNDNGTNPYLLFTYRQDQIKDSSIDFNKDCELVIFDYKNSCFAIILKNFRRMNSKNNLIVKSKTFFWSNLNSSNDDRKVNKILNYLLRSNTSFGVKRMKSQKEIIHYIENINKENSENESNLIAKETSKEAFKRLNSSNNNNHPSFLDKNFLSLNNNASSISPLKSFPKLAKSIPIPKDSANDEPNISGISANSFYNNTKTTNLSKHTLSELRRSTRTKEKPVKKYLDVDQEQEHEEPKFFKPTLRYKFEDGSKYTISNQDFKCLYNNDWINDSIIDFFIKFYVNKSISKEIASKDISIMSSFFYSKLVSDPENYYENVRSWVQHSDLFHKKFVILPINVNYHWFGCIITNLDSLLDFLLSQKPEESNKETLSKLNGSIKNETEIKSDSAENEVSTSNINEKSQTQDSDEISEVAPVVQILTFDSLRGIHSRELDPIKEFLIAYAKDKYSLTVDKSCFKMKTCLVPQQPNMSDCGVHVILTVKKFFENPKETMEVWRATSRKNRSASKFVNEYFEKNRRNNNSRKELRKVLWDLQDAQIKLMKENNEDPDNSDNDREEFEDEDLEIIEDVSAYKKKLNDVAEKKSTDVSKQGSKFFEISKSVDENEPPIVETNSNVLDEELSETYSDRNLITSDISGNQGSSKPNVIGNEHISNTARMILSSSKEEEKENPSSDDASVGIDTSNAHNSRSLPNEKYSLSSNASRSRIMSRYFPNTLRKRATGFSEEVSPVLSDIDYRELATQKDVNVHQTEIADLNSSPEYSQDEENSNIAYVDMSTNSQNVIISDLEQDDDVNLIGNYADSSLQENMRNDIEFNNEVKEIGSESNTSNIRDDINRELNRQGSSRYIDLSSPIRERDSTDNNNLSITNLHHPRFN